MISSNSNNVVWCIAPMVGELAGKLTYEPFRFDAAFPLREERFADEKRRIAVAAADMVVEGDTIALSPAPPPRMSLAAFAIARGSTSSQAR